MDQRFCAAPHGFSQLDTSFFAFPCLGIHRVPLLSCPSISGQPAKDQRSSSLVLFFFLTHYVKELRGANRSRTDDLLLARQAL